MKRVLRIVLRIVAAVLLLAGAFVGYACYSVKTRMAKIWSVNVPLADAQPGTFAIWADHDPSLLERGKYIVTKVTICADCHGDNLGGKAMSDDFMFGRLYAPNLTAGNGGIAHRYSDEDFLRVLLHGVKKDGRSVVFMPSQDIKVTERDAVAIVTYVRSLPPVDNTVPEPRIGPLASVLATYGDLPLLPAERIDHAHVGFAQELTATDAVSKGAHIVQMAGCVGCHTPTFEGGSGPPPGAGNITPVGIGTWTEKDFVTALRTHKRPDGSKIADGMPLGLGGMSDEDLSNVFAYLKTLPPKGQKTKHQMNPTE
jgi:mono/diheme cytochrome c family protein